MDGDTVGNLGGKDCRRQKKNINAEFSCHELGTGAM
jgi:hypothetical protein